MLAIAALSLDDEILQWAERWKIALQSCFSTRWRPLAKSAGKGFRKLLDSPEDMEEATWHCSEGLLHRRKPGTDQLLHVGRRLLADAIEPLEASARSSR